MPDDELKPDVESNCDEGIDLPKRKSNRKPHKTRLRAKSAKKINKNKESNMDDESKLENEILALKDDSSDVVLTKNSKTKGKKEKVGKMCQICGQIFKSLQAHLYVHDIYPKFECNVCHKKFRHKANVLSHMKIHTNQR